MTKCASEVDPDVEKVRQALRDNHRRSDPNTKPAFRSGPYTYTNLRRQSAHGDNELDTFPMMSMFRFDLRLPFRVRK